MRVGIASFLSEPVASGSDPMIKRLVVFGQEAENRGLDGVWVGDWLGRGTPTLDPLLPLAALCSVTDRIEFGTCVVQVPIRNPVELAHRVQTLNVLSGGRFIFGVGAGSTRADFDLLGMDFTKRFSTLKSSIDVMRRAWRGDPVNGVSLSPWEANGNGPPIALGAWRNVHWISYAAEHCEGWIASGLFSKWEQAEAGIRHYRRLGGKRAILANVLLDFREVPQWQEDWARNAEISLACPIDIARERLARIEDMGFDDVILLPPDESPEYLEMVSELLQRHHSRSR
jgi:alkanesulfonate monooxygenase SsuD/methylene tetrahydromethanopterin reductase-like flavin-dependent oxidoreductase (luciferase family)